MGKEDPGNRKQIKFEERGWMMKCQPAETRVLEGVTNVGE